MKMKFSFVLTLELIEVYKLVKPVGSKKDFIKELRYEIKMIGASFIDGEGIAWKNDSVRDIILFNLVKAGICEFTQKGSIHFKHFGVCS